MNKIELVDLNESTLKLCAKWACKPEIDASLFAPLAESTKQAARLLRNPKLKVKVIVADGEAIGYLTSREIAGNAFDSPPCLEVGILIGSLKMRNKGFGGKALSMFLDELFSDKTVHRVQAISDSENEPIRALLLKLGFKQEGVFREFTYRNNQWRDEAVFGLLREE